LQTIVGGKVNNQYICGCSIIADNVVLTAAHCIQ
jgi:V8-like Glu-specific endopeptidase